MVMVTAEHSRRLPVRVPLETGAYRLFRAGSPGVVVGRYSAEAVCTGLTDLTIHPTLPKAPIPYRKVTRCWAR